MGSYVIESQPMKSPPQGGGVECTEAVHWYYTPRGWTHSKKQAYVFSTPSAAVHEIGELRKVVDGVELTLMPVEEHGRTYYKPMG